VNPIKPGEVQVTTMEDENDEDLERPGFAHQRVEEIDVLNLAIGDNHPTGNRAAPIQ